MRYSKSDFLTSVSKLRIVFRAMDSTSRFVLSGGIMFIALAFQSGLSDRPESSSHKWSWLTTWIYDIAGSKGLFFFFLLIGILLIVKAFARVRT